MAQAGGRAEVAFPEPSWGIAATATSLLLLTRVVSLLRDVLLAGLYGPSGVTDAFFTALGVMNMIPAVLCVGLGVGLIPGFMRRRQELDEPGAWALAGVSLGILALAVTATGVLVAVNAGSVLRLVAPKLRDDEAREAAIMLRILMPLPLLYLGQLASAALLACYGRFLTSALLALMGASAGAATLWGLSSVMGVRAAAPAYLVGVALPASAGIWIVRKVGRLPGTAFRMLRQDAVQVFRSAGLFMLSELAIAGQFIVFLRCATASGPGVLSAFQFANKIQQPFLDAVIASVNQSAYPTIAAAAARWDMDSLRRQLGETVVRLITLLGPLMLGVLVLAEPVVTLLYGRGRFDLQAVRLTSGLLSILSLSLLPLAVKDLLSRLLFALGSAWSSTLAVVASSAASTLLMMTLCGVSHGRGLMVAFVTGSFLMAGWLAFHTGRQVGPGVLREAFRRQEVAHGLIPTFTLLLGMMLARLVWTSIPELGVAGRLGLTLGVAAAALGTYFLRLRWHCWRPM